MKTFDSFAKNLVALQSMQFLDKNDWTGLIQQDPTQNLDWAKRYQVQDTSSYENLKLQLQNFFQAWKDALQKHEPSLKEYFAYPVDILHFKFIYKSLLSGVSLEESEQAFQHFYQSGGWMDSSVFLKILRREPVSLMPPVLYHAYQKCELWMQYAENPIKPVEVDYFWDQITYDFYYAFFHQIGDPELLDFFAQEMDWKNVNHFIRNKALAISAKTSKDSFFSFGNLPFIFFQDLEEKSEFIEWHDALMKKMHWVSLANIPQTAEDALIEWDKAYVVWLKKSTRSDWVLWLKTLKLWERELSNIGYILTCKKNGISPDKFTSYGLLI